jgi:hypothetical protein
MVRVGSLFSQLLKQIPRDTFHGRKRSANRPPRSPRWERVAAPQ